MEISSLPQIRYHQLSKKTISLASSRTCQTNRLRKRRSFLQVTKKQRLTLKRRPSVRLTILDQQVMQKQVVTVPIRIRSRMQTVRASYHQLNLHNFNAENCNDYLVQFEREDMEDLVNIEE